MNENSVTLDQVYFSTQNGQILALDHNNMKLFRERLLHKQIEMSTIWDYPAKVKKRPQRRFQTGKPMSIIAEEHSRLQARAERLGDNYGQKFARRGTINLIKNLMKHRVQMVGEQLNLSTDSDVDSQASEGTKLRRMLQRNARAQLGRNKRGGTEVDLERGSGSEEEESDEGNYKTGGQVQLLRKNGKVARVTEGKVIPNIRNFGSN